MWRPFGIRLVSLSNHRDLFQCYSAEGPSQELRGGAVGAHGRPCDIARPCPWARERPKGKYSLTTHFYRITGSFDSTSVTLRMTRRFSPIFFSIVRTFYTPFSTWHPIGVHVVRLGYKNEQAHFCSTRLWHTSCAFFLDSKMVLQAVPLHSSYEKVPTFSHSNILYRDRHPDGLTLNK